MSTAHVKLLAKQAAFATCLTKWAAARGGVGSGKSISVVHYLDQRLNLAPRASLFVVGADYEQLRRGFFMTCQDVLEDLGYQLGRDYKYRENPNPMIVFSDGSGRRIRSLSAEQAERIRSVEIQTLICEEPQTWQDGHRVYSILAGRLRHSKRTGKLYPHLQPQGRMTFNPPPVGHWLHHLIEHIWPKPENRYPCWRFSLRDNKLLPGLDDYIKEQENANPPYRWPVEIEGHWETQGGDVYREFRYDIHSAQAPAGLPALKIREDQPLLISCDFNVEWMSWLIAQSHMQLETMRGMRNVPDRPPQPIMEQEVPGWQKFVVYFLDEIFMHNVGVPDALDELFLRYGDHLRRRGAYVYGDPSGHSRSQALSSRSAARSNWGLFKERMQMEGVHVVFRVPDSPPNVAERTIQMNSQFRSGDGFGVLADPVRCPELIVDWQSVRHVPGKTDIDKTDRTADGLKRTHLSDAAAYLVYEERMRIKALRRARPDFPMGR